MLKIGITGGIGTGKSFVCQLFKLLNIPVYNADEEAKKLCESDADLIKNIKITFGNEAYLKNGKYNRPYIAQMLFSNKDLKSKLESLIHPVVLRDSEEWFAHLQNKNGVPYALKEAAILFESGAYKYVNKIIVVDAPLYLRIDRIKKRDNVSEEEILKRFQNQWPNEKKIALADYIIHNDGKQSVINQVLAIHKKLISLPD